MGGITAHEFLAGKQLAQQIARRWHAVHEPASTSNEACILLELYPLRAADALQLAAALAVCAHKPQGYVFASGDLRLADAARGASFTVEII